MKRKAKMITAVLCSAVMLACSGCVAFLSTGTKTKNSKPVTISSEPIESSAEISEESKIKPVAHIGESATSDELKITFQSAKTYSIVNEKGIEQKPDSGKKYLILNFKAENLSEEDDFINIFYIKSYCDDMSIDQTYLLYYPDGYDSFTGDIAADKKLQGSVAFEVPKNWQKFELSYDPIDGAKLDFEVTAKEVENVN